MRRVKHKLVPYGRNSSVSVVGWEQRDECESAGNQKLGQHAERLEALTRAYIAINCFEMFSSGLIATESSSSGVRERIRLGGGTRHPDDASEHDEGKYYAVTGIDNHCNTVTCNVPLTRISHVLMGNWCPWSWSPFESVVSAVEKLP